jgi:7-carboxy-7-deazaguanine synthase
MGIDAVMDAVQAYSPCGFVELTGGEPLEQEDAFALLTALCEAGYTTAVETGGHIDISGVDPRVTIIMDVKCPASGMSTRNRMENLLFLKMTDEVKFVLCDESDYVWARGFVREHDLATRVGEIIFSPVFGSLEPRKLAGWVLRDGLQVRMQLQMHKYIWAPDARGV